MIPGQNKCWCKRCNIFPHQKRAVWQGRVEIETSAASAVRDACCSNNSRGIAPHLCAASNRKMCQMCCTAQICLHPRPLRACAEPPAGVSPPWRKPLVQSVISYAYRVPVSSKCARVIIESRRTQCLSGPEYFLRLCLDEIMFAGDKLQPTQNQSWIK